MFYVVVAEDPRLDASATLEIARSLARCLPRDLADRTEHDLAALGLEVCELPGTTPGD